MRLAGFLFRNNGPPETVLVLYVFLPLVPGLFRLLSSSNLSMAWFADMDSFGIYLDEVFLQWQLSR